LSNSRTLEEAICSCILNAQRSLHVGMPGRVNSYDSATQRAEVQPLIMPGYVDESGAVDYDDLQPLSDVPVMFLRSGVFSLTFPIAKGDLVYLHFTDFSIDEWLKEGGVRKPANHRNHDISDAVCTPSLYHNSTDQVHATDAVLSGPMRLGSKDATDPVALKSDLDALKTYLDSHTHAGLLGGTGSAAALTSPPTTNPLGTPTNPAPTPVGATKVRAE